MATQAYVAHQMRGRVRLRVPHARHQPAALHQMAETVRKTPGVRSAEVNPTTGSLLIHYSETALHDFAGLVSALSESGLPLELIKAAGFGGEATEIEEYSEAAKTIAALMRGLDRQTKSATNNQIDLRALVPLIAAAGGVAFLAGSPTPSTPLWLTLMIFAFSSFVSLYQVETTDDRPAGAQAQASYLH